MVSGAKNRATLFLSWQMLLHIYLIQATIDLSTEKVDVEP